MMQYQAKRKASAPKPPAHRPEAKGPSLQALRAGAAPTAEQLGHPVDLPGAIRAKMEASFGADLSGVRLYESQTVADAGAEAVAMGSRISFAPGKLDFSSGSGQALLGHELSHVVSQARGEVAGSGFLNDHALEARADREGAMAAAGESVYSGPMTPVSASSTAQAAGPMQAKKPLQKLQDGRRKKKIENMEISEPQKVRQQHIKQDEAGRYVIDYTGRNPNDDLRGYNSLQGAAIGMVMRNMSDDELRESKGLQDAFLPQYIKDTQARLNDPKGGKHALSLDMVNAEQGDYNRLLRANVTDDMANEMGIVNSDHAGKALDKMGDHIQQNGKLKRLLTGGAEAMMGAVGGDQEKAKAGALERFARQGIVPALSKKDKAIRRNMAERRLGPGAGEKEMNQEMEQIGRLNAGTLGSNILDRYDHAKEGEAAKEANSSKVLIGKRPINISVFQDGERYKRSLD